MIIRDTIGDVGDDVTLSWGKRRRNTIIGVYFRRCGWLLLLAATFVLLLNLAWTFVTGPFSDADATEAARSVVAWIVEGKPIAGFDQAYPESRKRTKRFFVVCDFLPLDVQLSGDPRVQRIKAEDQDAIFKKHEYKDGANYIVVSLKSQSAHKLVIEVSNTANWLAGYGFEFEFRRSASGLRARGKMLWIS